MKIIKKGKTKWVDRVTCTCCDSLLEITAEDIEYKLTEEAARRQEYQEEIEGEYFVICPVCSEPMKLRKLPTVVKNEVRINQ